MCLTQRYYSRDDGQRSLRYTPLYANSGFYYLRGTLDSMIVMRMMMNMIVMMMMVVMMMRMMMNMIVMMMMNMIVMMMMM